MGVYRKVGNFNNLYEANKASKKKETIAKAKKQWERAKDWGKVAQGIDDIMHPFRGLGFTKKQRQAKGISNN